ncbi:unnamed protein product [Durusdinium trenchii]|uniref:C3H1-type domain-containing protein n=1 Tax=Durusdinium trenchii TaxID=1381693 RepID=A0ABP0HSF9_9DINO
MEMAKPFLKLTYRKTFIDCELEEQPSKTPLELKRSVSLPSIELTRSEDECHEATYLNHLTHKLSEEKSDWSGSPTSTVSTACDSDEVTPCHEIEMPSSPKLAFQLLPSPGTLGHPEVCRRPCMHFQIGHCDNGSSCNFCHEAHPHKTAKLDKKQRLLLQSLKIQEFTALIAQEVRERPNSGVPAGAAEELLAALEDEAQGAPLPRIPDRDLRNLRKTFVTLAGYGSWVLDG